MGNTESVIVSRHERKHRSGGRSYTRVSPLEHEHHHQKRRRHTPSSDSDISGRRPKRKVRFEKPETPLVIQNRYPGGHRYTRDYSYGGYTGMEYIVDQGYVTPGIYPHSAARTTATPNQGFNRPPPPRPTTQRRHDIHNRAGSHIPQKIVPIIYEDDESSHRPEQYSRVLPVPRRRMGRNYL